MMGEIVEDHGISPLDALAFCMLASWWILVLISLISDPGARLGLSASVFGIVMLFAPMARISIYASGYAPPISFRRTDLDFPLVDPGL